MTRLNLLAVIVGAAFAAGATNAGAACPDPAHALPVSRVIEIDASTGPIFGELTRQVREKRFLGPKEIVLTFDDGPFPHVTRSILDTLDRFCTKATFFSVGTMALEYPQLSREVVARGHTLGAHTWSHPLNLRRLSFDKARDQIEAGFAAVSAAAGEPIAPFFRFPGLSDSHELLAYMQKRGIATFTVDVVSNDSFIHDPVRLIARTIAQAEANNGGILLFHDIKHVTARALPTILTELRQRGFKVVHIRAKAPYRPLPSYAETIAGLMKGKTTRKAQRLIAFTDSLKASQSAPSPAHVAALDPSLAAAPVVALAPEARDRSQPVKGERPHATRTASASAHRRTADTRRPVVARVHRARAIAQKHPAASQASWTTTLYRRMQEGGG